MNFVVGLDVGGAERGFHGAILGVQSKVIFPLIHATEPIELLSKISAVSGTCQVIAIDCPPRANIKGPLTREAERELHQEGYRVQWTPRSEKNSQGWMQNGERLWRFLNKKLPNTTIIETFPTASADGLRGVDISLDLGMLHGRPSRKFYKDYLDACICAATAKAYLNKKTKIYGIKDELGPIHCLKKLS